MIDSPAAPPAAPDPDRPDRPDGGDPAVAVTGTPDSPPAPAPRPVAERERIAALDVLRGFALLGILAMNIASFSQPMAAYSNPTVLGRPEGAEFWIYAVSYVVFSQKFMSLFSILFGAGVLLMTRRAEARSGRSAALHYRRMLWLLLIGLLHAHLIWYGDILVLYAVCGMAVYPLRRLRPRLKVAIAIAVMLVPTAVSVRLGSAAAGSPERIEAMRAHWDPPPETVAEEVAIYRGGWWGQMAHRVPASVQFETVFTLLFGLWRAGGLMLLGMALLEWGVLSAERSRRFYAWLALAGLGIGLPVVVYGLSRLVAADWEFPYAMFFGETYNYWAAPLVSLGYVGLLVLALGSRRGAEATAPLAAVGRMAFTNYLMHSVICTLIFYGHGLGLFGRVGRPAQVLIVLGIWALQLVVSPIWLHHFRFGPAEWLWRSLTYRRLQPMRRSAPVEAAALG